MQGTQLYDASSNPIYPSTYARNVDCGVVLSGNTVYDDISQLLARYQALSKLVSGGTEVENKLNVVVTYSTNVYSSKSDAEGADYGEDFILPSAAAPYAWQKTVYYWGTDVVKTTYHIVSTALYPETQVMYASTGTSISGSSLQGPADFSSNNAGAQDQSGNGVMWYYFFPGIDGSKPIGYMAVRHRDAGQAWPATAIWQISQMAQYPITS